MPRRNAQPWRRSLRATGIAIVACAALAGGCRRPPADGGEAPAQDASQAEQKRLDELRSLPYLDFDPTAAPDRARDGVVALDSARAAPGYTLYTVRATCRADLVDLRGRILNSWQYSPCGRWAQAELLPDGSLLVVGREGKAGRVLLKFGWTGELLWRQQLPVHHDAELTPAGQLLTITLRNRRVELAGETHAIRDDLLTLLDANGNVLETRSLFDLFGAGPAPNPFRLVRARIQGVLDVFHANSVETMRIASLFGTSPLYAPDHVLVSVRHQDLVAIVDWKRSRLVWSWGPGELDGPHDASLLANGHILIFDNGLARGWSRVVELDPATNRIVWQYLADPPQEFYSDALGGAQRLPNGNTLIAYSVRGEAFEVTPDSEVVWRYRVPYKNLRGHRAAIIRAKRYDAALVEPLLAAGGKR